MQRDLRHIQRSLPKSILTENVQGRRKIRRVCWFSFCPWKGLPVDKASQGSTSPLKGVLGCTSTGKEMPIYREHLRLWGDKHFSFTKSTSLGLQLLGANIAHAFNWTYRYYTHVKLNQQLNHVINLMQEHDSWHQPALLNLSRGPLVLGGHQSSGERFQEIFWTWGEELWFKNSQLGNFLCLPLTLLPSNAFDFSPSGCPRKILHRAVWI